MGDPEGGWEPGTRRCPLPTSRRLQQEARSQERAGEEARLQGGLRAAGEPGSPQGLGECLHRGGRQGGRRAPGQGHPTRPPRTTSWQAATPAHLVGLRSARIKSSVLGGRLRGGEAGAQRSDPSPHGHCARSPCGGLPVGGCLGSVAVPTRVRSQAKSADKQGSSWPPCFVCVCVPGFVCWKGQVFGLC